MEVDVEKRCSKCGETKDVALFFKNRNLKGGYCAWCKACESADKKARRAKDPQKAKERAAAYRVANAEALKERSREYYARTKEQRAERARAYYQSNRAKLLAAGQAWAEANPEKVLAKGRRWAQANPDKVAEKSARWRKANPEKAAANTRKWQQANPEKAAAHASKRHAAMRQPAWGDKGAIDEIFAEARRLTLESGVPHQVDHVIPIRHPLVCGLHVPDNLQVLTATDNRNKHNKIPAEEAHLFADLPKEWVWTR